VRSILLLTAAVAAAAGVVVHDLPEGDAQAAVVVTHRQTIESISIDGGRGLPFAQLRDAMETKLGSSVETAKLAQDRAIIERELAARGYLTAKVAEPVVTFGPTGGIYVVFDVERGPMYRVRTVTLDGPSWKDAGVVTISAGDDALGDRLTRVRQAAEETLARHGKPLHVELQLTPDRAEAMVDVRLITR
jgi:outer membrane protein assembly factor BamA